MTYTIKIDSLLPSLNEYVRECRGNKYGANSVNYIIETFGADRPNIDQQVMLHFLWREANRKRDKDNVAFAKKFILDAFVRYGILSGDGWNVVDGFTDDFVLDKEDPGVTVTVEVIE